MRCSESSESSCTFASPSASAGFGFGFGFGTAGCVLSEGAAPLGTPLGTPLPPEKSDEPSKPISIASSPPVAFIDAAAGEAQVG